MPGQLFTFDETWRLAAPPGPVVEALADVDGYATWWREVRRVERIDAESGRASIRSLLPVTLRLVLTREVEDQAAGLLRVRVDGDLVGWSQWRVAADEAGSSAHFTQEVTADGRALRAATGVPFGTAVLRVNHAAMMRSGERGLRRHLA